MRLIAFVLIFAFAAACHQPSVRSNRVDPDAIDGLGGSGIDSQELRTTCQQMARSLLASPALFARGTPRVIVDPPENRTSFMIDSQNFSGKIRTELMKHAGSRIVFLAREDWNAISTERELKRDGVVGHSGLQNLAGADYLLSGTLGSLSKQSSAGRSDYFSCRFRLVDLETSQLLWEDEYEFKKGSSVGAVYR